MSFTEEQVQELMDGLGYSFSQPEMTAFSEAVHDSNKRKAKRMLVKEGYSDEEAEAMYAYCRKEALGSNVDLVEVPKSEWGNLTREENYVVRIGRSVKDLYIMSDRTMFVGGSHCNVSIKQFRQVWQLVQRTKKPKPSGPTFTYDDPDGFEDTLEISMNGEVIATVDHDTHGWAGMTAVRDVVEAIEKKLNAK